MVAIHESLIGQRKKIADYRGTKAAISSLHGRIETSKRSIVPEQRRNNVRIIKGLINDYLVDGQTTEVYGAHSTVDTDGQIRRSEIELPHYELKQGMLTLDERRILDGNVIDKVIKTICAIANNGKGRSGSILIRVANKDEDSRRIKILDGIEPRRIGRRHVVVRGIP